MKSVSQVSSHKEATEGEYIAKSPVVTNRIKTYVPVRIIN
jgi:hypothetical protein